MPSAQHEAAISTACNEDSYCKHSFMFFVKIILLNASLPDDLRLDSKGVFDELRLHTSYSSQRYKAATMKRLKAACKESGAGVYAEALDTGHDEWDEYTAEEMTRRIDCACNCVPDCWKFQDHRLLVLEVVDTSRVGWKQLMCFALIQDILINSAADTHFSVAEYDITRKSVFHHNLVAVYDLELDTITHHALKGKTDRQRLRWYYDNIYFGEGADIDRFETARALSGVCAL